MQVLGEEPVGVADGDPLLVEGARLVVTAAWFGDARRGPAALAVQIQELVPGGEAADREQVVHAGGRPSSSAVSRSPRASLYTVRLRSRLATIEAITQAGIATITTS